MKRIRNSSLLILGIGLAAAPGLKVETDHTIAGTPDTSGTWKAGIGFTGLSCKGRDGKVQAYADQTVSVTITIQ
jgi:hypothetical protein